ncbi:MAG: peptidoglycan bridge formation glycyltransferase FemA/FemB family protein [Paludibacteraceae bacterium]|nr:peptidoglycan bridge formation glycyltransferase FemA/FemB family protein [Paludibacteraceae bacterium]
MKILSGNNIDRKAWAVFVAKHPQGNIFQTPEMYDVYACAEHVTPMAIAAVEEDEIVGILVAQYMTNGGSLASWITARSIITGGPLARNNDPATIQALMDAYKKHLPSKTIYSEIRPIYSMDDVPGWKRVGHYNLVMRLEKTEEELFEQMHKERRRNVNQAIKAGLTFKELTTAEEIQQVVALIEKTYRRKHVPIGYLNMFDKVQGILKDYAHFFGCYTAEGQMIAGQVRLCYGTLVYAWFAGSDENYFKLRPNDFTMWNVIRWAREKGYKEFDFGGGGEPGKPYGVRDYKLKYGCEMFDYGRYLLTHRPITYWAAATAYKLYHKIQGKQ